MNILYFIFAFLVGIATSVQSGVNSQLRQALAHPIQAALISFGSGFVVLTVMSLALRAPVPTYDAVRDISWWKWTGGLLGAIYVTTVIITVPRIGAGNLLSLSVAGQLLAAVILDHYGLLGFKEHGLTIWRLMGVLLIILGVVLVVKN
ncbi:DMT family transporter [Larkinella terrae]|uniref:EamA-like transporter family protein n=1 Tax=Larkinella terrae TaxID=2025311 RepID=A0A7K0EGT3_9BACT|nr:DMT family transporter [Larkinella terrae]MRS61014.1 EamA-like transporter family protein [Larkinella terrae]